MLVVKPEIPAKTIPELVELVQGEPRQIHLRLGRRRDQPASLRRDAEAARRHQHAARALSRRRAGPAGPARRASRIRCGTTSLGRCRIKDRKLRPLAVTSLEPSPVAPELPTDGSFYPGFQITSWGGAVRPGRPAAGDGREGVGAVPRRRWRATALKAVFFGQGATALWTGPADTVRRSAAREEKLLAPIIMASGARVG